MLDTGHENVHRKVCRATRKVDEVATQRGKTSIFPRKLRERLIYVTGAHSMNRVFCASSRGSLLEKIRKRREQRCSLLEKAKKQKMERERAIGECEAMLNSSPGKGIIDTGRAQIMMGSDTFKQHLDLLTSRERASVEKVRERSRFPAVIPMNIGKHVCREKVAIILADLKAIPPTYGSSSGPGEKTGDIQ